MFVCYVFEIWDGMGVVICVERVYTVGSVAAAATAILWEHVECGFFCFCFLFFFSSFFYLTTYSYTTHDTPPLTYYIRRYCYSPLVSWFIIIDIAEPSPTTRVYIHCTNIDSEYMSLLYFQQHTIQLSHSLLLHC